jgi:hypothetical protein
MIFKQQLPRAVPGQFAVLDFVDVRRCNGILQWRLKFDALRQHCEDLKLLWYAVLREVNSCVRNIWLLRATKLYLYPGLLYQGLECFRNGNWTSEECCHACIDDIQKVVAKFPWVSRVDYQMILAAWELGEKRSRSNSGLDNEQRTSKALPVPPHF